MISLLLTLAIYSVIILLFVPLDKIAKAQAWIHKKFKELKDKIEK